jgi:hypothetical protein
MKYYSEKLNKLFDTEKELVSAEKAQAAEETKKQKAAEQKKAEAKVVEDAFKARNAARREYNAKVVEARKVYNDAIVAAKKVFDDTLTEITNNKDKAEEAYNGALKEFTDKHPEGYHMTLKDGDNVVTLSSSVNDKPVDNAAKEYSDFLKSLINIWKF